MNILCSVAGSGRHNLARGFCKNHYGRFMKYGDPLRGRHGHFSIDEVNAAISNVLAFDEDECLVWPLSKTSAGYGRVTIDGRTTSAHRHICEIVYGSPPTSNHVAAHSCGKGHTGCVNKRHLRWATHKENQDDRLIHGTHNRGEKYGRSKLTESQVREILSLKGSDTQTSIAKKYGVSLQNVNDIMRRKNWAWIDTTFTEI
jgi:hypothetical protein